MQSNNVMFIIIIFFSQLKIFLILKKMHQSFLHLSCKHGDILFVPVAVTELLKFLGVMLLLMSLSVVLKPKFPIAQTSRRISILKFLIRL